jgi:hypothetical protein
MRISFLFFGCLFVSSLFVSAFYAMMPVQAEASATSAQPRSAIQRLNARRAAERGAQVYLPTAFSRDKANSVTVKGGGGGERIAIVYRFLPLQNEEAAAEKTVVSLDPAKPVTNVTIPLPESEQFKAETDAAQAKKQEVSPREKNPKGGASLPGKPVETTAYKYNSIQIQAVTLDDAGNIVQQLPVYTSGGQRSEHGVLPLVDPHNPSQAMILPAIPGVDPAALRGVQTMAEFATNEDKRKRLEYDGTINRNRSTDRNSFGMPAPSQQPVGGSF